MIIPLDVDNFAGSLRIMTHFVLRSEDPKLFLPIRAIVDTGSPLTLIGPADIARMRVSKFQLNSKLEGRPQPVSVGGGQISTKILKNAKIKFGNGFETELDVDFPVKNEEKSVQPSLLGMNFLLETKSKLFFDGKNHIAHLEIED